MKKETLEEVAKRYSYGGREGGHRIPFLEGVKWKQEIENQQKLKHNEMLKMLKIISNGFDDSKKYLIIKKAKEIIKEITEI